MLDPIKCSISWLSEFRKLCPMHLYIPYTASTYFNTLMPLSIKTRIWWPYTSLFAKTFNITCIWVPSTSNFNRLVPTFIDWRKFWAFVHTNCLSKQARWQYGIDTIVHYCIDDWLELIAEMVVSLQYVLHITQSVITLELVIIQLGFSSEIINFSHYLSVTI